MKNLLLVLAMVAGVSTSRLLAQSNEMGNKEKMEVFSGWPGRWQGEGSMKMGPGEPRKSTVDEWIQSKLDGMVILIEGSGTATDPATKKETIVHQALAVLSFDGGSDQYKFRTYLKDGRATEAWLKVLEHNKYQWGFETPRGKTRYNITLDPLKKTWNEVGEYSSDGNTWMKFFEMNLKKTE
jgi:hypothetical protein